MSTLNFEVKLTVTALHENAAAVQSILANYCYNKMAVIKFSSSNFSFESHKWSDSTDFKYTLLGQVVEDSSIRACLDFKLNALDDLKKILPPVKKLNIE